MMRLPSLFKRKQPELPKPIDHTVEEIIAQINKPIPPKSKGRVIKQTRHSEFNPNPVKGGRIVKVMPRQLQKIKAAQEMVEDDDGPKLEDLSD